ncbi:fimbria/pilus outer membrane usher protein [Lysobacter sp. FW306-1B-D06B]|uniref:fimbria/pilus outer membrane usher protein n=1 Tax=Lysobacter sp. FW306-1B-D06B TaxID=3140250 RepID=UPI003140BB0D
MAPFAAVAAPDPSPNPSPEPGPAQVEFNAGFLGGATAAAADLSRFERGNPMPTGAQRVDLYVNEYLLSRETVTFRDDGSDTKACFTRTLLTTMGVNVGKLEAEGANLDGDCLDLPALVPGATVYADAGDLSLRVSVPQISMSHDPRGWVDPSLWDRGVNAFTLGYTASGNQSQRNGHDSNLSGYLGLDAGLNLGGWRIRNQSSYQWNRDGNSDFQSIRTYAQHDVDRLKAQLTVGDTFTTGQLFDSVGFRGVQLASDERMLPDSQRTYAPIIRGTAETNATVEVRQAGFVLYQTTVAPGAFEVNDLSAVGYGGDLEVTVREADGRVQTFTVPYAAVPQLLRAGTSRFSATAGEVRDQGLVKDAPIFVEGTYQRGINNALTAYAGVQAAGNDLYRAALIGAAVSTPVGAFAADITGARTRFSGNGGDQSGYSARVTYSKAVPSTSTNFTLAAYRYSTEGFLSLGDAVRLDDDVRTGALAGGVMEGAGRQRSKFDIMLSQRLGDRAGSLYVSGSRNDYWDADRSVDTSYQLGWNNRYRNLTYGVSANRARVAGGDYDNSYYFTLSVPLGGSGRTSHTPMLSVAGSHGRDGNGVQARVSGSAGDRSQFNYGVNGNFNDNNTDSVGANVGWRTPYNILGASYTQGSGYNSASVNASGGLVIHRGGITLAQSLGDTIGVVQAKGAKGARLNDGISKIDGRGYGIVNSLMPYRMNDVSLDPAGMSMDVELGESRYEVAPRAGAVVPITFETTSGATYLIQAQQDNGNPLPFGAEVRDSAGNVVGYVGQGGQAFVRLPDENSVALSVMWNGNGQCTIDWNASAATKSANGIAQISNGVCHAR